MNYRLRFETVARMRAFWWLNYSQIARKSVAWVSDGGVVTTQNAPKNTRENSIPVTLKGISKRARHMDATINAFLDTIGQPIDRNALVPPDDSANIQPLAVTLSRIRQKTLAVK